MSGNLSRTASSAVSPTMSGNMFGTLESNWDQSGRRGWTTLASFGMQALGLSLLLAIPLIWVQRAPQVHWLQRIVSPAALPQAAPEQPQPGHRMNTANANPLPEQITAPPSIPLQINLINDAGPVQSAPDLPTTGVGIGRGSREGVPGGFGNTIPVVAPPRTTVTKPLVVSHWAEGNLLLRVQPNYPPIAREARIQGTVELRAIISKAGTIENLVAVGGPPMLVKSAIDAVRQWRYRPYLLNNEAIEVETEITVNFVLSN
jgi:periplasmic protein TonB